ncbi:MAG: protein-disulfide reductase DsbD domain-containing protein [Verrucomicrobiota bacterium]
MVSRRLLPQFRFLIPSLPAAVLLLGAAIPAPLRADGLPDQFKGSGLRVRLVSDVTAIQPGAVFHIGLWIQHDFGYHTYWSNPGIAGVPTHLTPELPPGFTAGNMIYPPPDKVRMAGLRVHGYERDVLVALPVTAPKEVSAPVTIKTKASWMCCRTTCNPGFADLALTLPPVSAGAPAPAPPNTEWKPKFETLLASQPPAAAGWVFTARKNGAAIHLTATPPPGLPLPEKPQFFSADNLICSHPEQGWKPLNGSQTVSLTLSDFPPKDPTRLRGLLHSPVSSLLPGTSESYVSLDIPIQPEAVK